MKPTTAARRSYDKQRAASRASSVGLLRARVGPAPLTVELAAAPEAWFVVLGSDGVAVAAGRFQLMATYIDGFVAGWTLASGQGLHQGDHAQQ